MPPNLPSHQTSPKPSRVAASLLAAMVIAVCACSDSTSPAIAPDSGAGPDASADGPLGDGGETLEAGRDAAADANADAEQDASDGRSTSGDASPDAGSDGSGDGGDARLIDARSTDGSEADGRTCTPDVVWPGSARGFTYRQSGGFVAPVPMDSGCVGPATNYDYVAAGQTLAERSCTFGGRVDRTITLSAAETSQLAALLNALRTSCPATGCGADYPDVTLEVRPATGASTVYTSDFYAGCGGAQVHPPYVAFSRLGELSNLLRGFVTAACAGDGGSDASTCVND
jgi:hypothetical protein